MSVDPVYYDPKWDVDMDNARLLSTSTVRGWDKLPARVR
jgi:hypothetical protein